MITKIHYLLSLVIAFFILTVSPARAGLDGSEFEGLYVGLNIDYATRGVDTIFTALTDPDDATAMASFGGVTGTENNAGYGGGLYGGYGFSLFGGVYLSGEAGFSVYKGGNNVTDGDETFGITASNAFDVNIRLGYVVSDNVLVYGLAGFASTKFNSEGFGDDKVSQRLSGFRYGAGFEVGIMEDIALRVEYTRAEYSSFRSTTMLNQFDFDPDEQRFIIGLVLHMD